jgi:WD40 repeat protein
MKTKLRIAKTGTFVGHKGSIFAMTANEKENALFTSGDDGIVAKWNIESPEIDAKGILKMAVPNYSLLFVEEYNLLITGASDGHVSFVDTEKKEIVHIYRKVPTAVYALLYDKETDFLWVLHGTGFFSVVKMSERKEIAFNRLAMNHLRTAKIYQDQILIGASDGNIYLLNKHTFMPIKSWKAHENSVFSLFVLSENKILLSGGRDARLNVWDLQNDCRNVDKIPAHLSTINDIVASPSANFFATSSRDKTIKIWDSYTFELLKVIDFARNQSHTYSVNKLLWIKEKNCLLSCSDDKLGMKWEIEPQI